jgi:hypothetical protein
VVETFSAKKWSIKKIDGFSSYASWKVRKQRNGRVFQNHYSTVVMVVARIEEEAAM